MIKKTFVEEETLLNDAFRMAVSVYESGFAPTFIVGIWRGGSSVGIYVQECLQFLGVESDHISIRTSYAGLPEYQKSVDDPSSIRVHGLQYLLETIANNKYAIARITAVGSIQLEPIILEIISHCNTHMSWVAMSFIECINKIWSLISKVKTSC